MDTISSVLYTFYRLLRYRYKKVISTCFFALVLYNLVLCHHIIYLFLSQKSVEE